MRIRFAETRDIPRLLTLLGEVLEGLDALIARYPDTIPAPPLR